MVSLIDTFEGISLSGVTIVTCDGLLSKTLEVIRNTMTISPLIIPVKDVSDNFAENLAGKISRIFPKILFNNCGSCWKKPGFSSLLGDGSV